MASKHFESVYDNETIKCKIRSNLNVVVLVLDNFKDGMVRQSVLVVSICLLIRNFWDRGTLPQPTHNLIVFGKNLNFKKSIIN